MTTYNQLWRKLATHDWSYHRSDDHGAYRRGVDEWAAIETAGRISEEHAGLVKAFRSFKNGDRSIPPYRGYEVDVKDWWIVVRKGGRVVAEGSLKSVGHSLARLEEEAVA